MFRKFNLLLIVGLSSFYFQSHSKEISKHQGSQSSSIEEIAEEMIHFNATLDSLSTTISNLFPGRRLNSSF